ncbi:hypothetical protein PY093_14430 [Cytobacillus sp. S13-E01]|uniref:hypothetical protein n=1 Tax=Cytobacillus sp. S13-E01 TaxID=3031326 RepID=UPI0023D7E9CA|nr:hypothetical protein [Cytobacillus sp. S13-E01]MDF0727871.1 hypothetical protein [Cytobacillus sp. S13-E01]
MSGNKKEKVIYVDNLIIHAKNVEIIHDRIDDHIDDRKEGDFSRRDPWGLFWGKRKQMDEVNEQEGEIQDIEKRHNLEDTSK